MGSHQDQDQVTYLIPVEKDQRPFKCGLCCFAYDHLAQLEAHIGEHCKIKPFQCGYCLVSYDSVSELTRHVDTHQIFKCVAKDSPGDALSPGKGPKSRKKAEQESKASTPRRGRPKKLLKKDKKSKKRPSEFECEVCQQSFKYQKDLRKHAASDHGDDRAFSCARCPSRFRKQYMLRDHMIVKHGSENKAFECEFCGRRYKTLKCLRDHTYQRHPKAKSSQWKHRRRRKARVQSEESGSEQKTKSRYSLRSSFGKLEMEVEEGEETEVCDDGKASESDKNGKEASEDDDSAMSGPDDENDDEDEALPHTFLTT